MNSLVWGRGHLTAFLAARLFKEYAINLRISSLEGAHQGLNGSTEFYGDCKANQVGCAAELQGLNGKLSFPYKLCAHVSF